MSEEKLQSVNAYRDEQGVEDYGTVNRGWIGILVKMASWKTLGAPQGKDVSPQTKQMFNAPTIAFREDVPKRAMASTRETFGGS